MKATRTNFEKSTLFKEQHKLSEEQQNEVKDFENFKRIPGLTNFSLKDLEKTKTFKSTWLMKEI